MVVAIVNVGDDIVSGAQHPRFMKLLTGMITPAQAERITQALAPIAG